MRRLPRTWVLPAVLVVLLALAAGRGDPAAEVLPAPASATGAGQPASDPPPAAEAAAAPAPSAPPTPLPLWYLTPEAEAALSCAPERPPPPNPVQSLDDLALVQGSRCPEGVRTYLILLDEREGLLLETPGEQALELEGSIELSAGRHEGERALPLASLLEGRGEVRAVQIWPCTGDPLVLEASEVLAAPRRHVLVRNRAGSLKLLDLEPGDAAVRPLRNLAAIRLLR